MLPQANDFREESRSLAAILENASDDDFKTETLFKNWTIEDIIAHLYIWNLAAAYTLESREKFQTFLGQFMSRMSLGHLKMQKAWLDEECNGLSGLALFNAWKESFEDVADRYSQTDPEQRVAWAGPDMTAQSKIIARQMETWAHGQAIFDVLGLERTDKDRLRSVAELGVRTYGWTFRNRNEEPPQPKPFVRLTGPSGAIWEWNDAQDDNKVEGAATEFCQVVTQTRNIADTALNVTGDPATRWMSQAQCFAGAPETPPAKGARHKA